MSERLRFMVDTFQVREILSDLSREKSIKGVRIRTGPAGEAIVAYHGWSFLFSEGGVSIYRGTHESEKKGSGFLIITNERKMLSKGDAVIRISQTGALKVSIDSKGGIKVRSFLKKNLPLWEREVRYPGIDEPTIPTKSRSKAPFS
jgi:hypothetical protein